MSGTRNSNFTGLQEEKSQKNAGPNTNQYYLASVCKSSGKPSTRFPLGGHVELKTSPEYFHFFVRQNKNCHFSCFQHLFEIWSAPKPFICQRSRPDINTHLIHTYKLRFRTIHFIIVWANYLPSRVTGQEKLFWSAGPHANQYVNRAVNRQPDFRSGDT